MRTQLRVVPLCACFVALLSLHPSIAPEQEVKKDQKDQKAIPPAIAREMHALQTILFAQPNDPAALFNLAMDYASIGVPVPSASNLVSAWLSGAGSGTCVLPT